MWPWHVKIHTNSSNVTQHLITTSCRQFWQPCCWQLNKTKAMLMMQDEKKLCCWCKICPKCNIDFSKFWHEFICFDMDLSKTLYGFLEVVAWVYRVVYLFLAICQKKTSWSLTKISKLVEASPLNKRCWLSQSIQCLGSVLPLAMFKMLTRKQSMMDIIIRFSLHLLFFEDVSLVEPIKNLVPCL